MVNMHAHLHICLFIPDHIIIAVWNNITADMFVMVQAWCFVFLCDGQVYVPALHNVLIQFLQSSLCCVVSLWLWITLRDAAGSVYLFIQLTIHLSIVQSLV